MEVLIPFVTASIIDRGIEAGNIHQVYLYGGVMLAMALLSLACGVLAGRYAAKASSGWPATCGKGFMRRCRPSPSPTSTATAPPALSPG